MKKRMKNNMKSFLTLSAMFSWLISGFFLSQILFPPIIDTTPVPHHEKTTAELIVTLAQNNNFNVATAIRIANCESKLGTQKINNQGSSAKGVYMFIDKTWSKYCDGDVMNDYDNIMCFIKLYKQHPTWWSCR